MTKTTSSDKEERMRGEFPSMYAAQKIVLMVSKQKKNDPIFHTEKESFEHPVFHLLEVIPVWNSVHEAIQIKVGIRLVL